MFFIKNKNLTNWYLFIFFTLSIFLFSFNIAYSDSMDCAGEDVCVLVTFHEPSYCTQTGVPTYACNCGSSDASCQVLSTFSCGHKADPIYSPVQCNKAETCICTPPPTIPGCTDPAASNYNSNATTNDGSCTYPPPPGPECGDGDLDPGEQCDLGINNGSCPGGCSNSCTTISCGTPGPSCGDGVVDPGEQCDTGINNGNCPRTCSNSCTVNSCGSTTATLTFTSTGPGNAVGYTSAADGPPYTYLGTCRNTTCIVPMPINTFVTIQAIHDVAGGIFNWQAVCPALGLGDICKGTLNANYSAGVTFVAPTVPVNNNVSISSINVEADGTTQYEITVTSSDSGGGGKINIQHALINHQGTNSGQYRGWLAWGINGMSWWTGHKDLMACTGGGGAMISSLAPSNIYGHDYIELDACRTTVVAGTRSTTFTVRFNTNFTSPISDNDISAYASNTDNNTDGWDNYDINFGLVTTPTNPVVTISPSIIVANNSALHQISITGTDLRGGNNISPQYALINHQGTRAGQYRGYLTWGLSGGSWWVGQKNLMACTGGGHAAIQSLAPNNVYGHDYIELVSCSTSVTGNTRNTIFNVRFDNTFNATGPYTLNDISGILYNLFNKTSGWVNSDLNFGLDHAQYVSQTVPTTMNTGQTYNIPITMRNTGVSTWTQAGNYKLGSQNPQDNTTWGTSRVLLSPGDSVANGAEKTFTVTVTAPSTPGTYNFRWRMVREGVQWFGQSTPNVSVNVAQAPAVPTVTSPTVSNVTQTGATLGANVQSAGVPATILERGTCWGTTNPPSTNCSPASGLTTGVYTHARTGMSPGVTYYFRGYATNSTGTGYSPASSFTTNIVSTYTLNVTANPGPGGRITGPGIDCGSDCSENVPQDTTVQLTAVPASSYWKFNGWGGACSGTSLVCNVTVSSDPTSVTATFSPRAFIYREF